MPTDSTNRRKPASRVSPARAKSKKTRAVPQITREELDRLIAQSPSGEWNAGDDVDVFKPCPN